jgi:hypothetical protein
LGTCWKNAGKHKHKLENILGNPRLTIPSKWDTVRFFSTPHNSIRWLAGVLSPPIWDNHPIFMLVTIFETTSWLVDHTMISWSHVDPVLVLVRRCGADICTHGLAIFGPHHFGQISVASHGFVWR